MPVTPGVTPFSNASCPPFRRDHGVVIDTSPFFIRDQGDGWWHCPSPLRCSIIDGPDVCNSRAEASRANNTRFWLVEVDPPIVWNGERRFVDTYGPDDALCRPFGPTARALVFAVLGNPYVGGTPWHRARAREWRDEWTDLDGDGSIPVYPVDGATRSVRTAETLESLGMKVGVYRGARRPFVLPPTALH